MGDYGLENLVTASHAALENQALRYLDLSWCGSGLAQAPLPPPATGAL